MIQVEAQVVALLAVAVLVAYVADRFRLPYTVAMVLTGLGVSVLRPGLASFQVSELEPELILITFLPGLLFEAGYHINLSDLRDNLPTILIMAIPGLVISAAISGGLISLGLGLPLATALLFGVLISATDPIAVTALFKELGVDKRLGVIVEGESLFNDGVSIVLYSILVGVAMGQTDLSLANGIADLLVTVAGGAALGAAVGFLTAELMRHTEKPLIDLALTSILAYGLYLFAEEALHGRVSPVIAVVVAAIVVGSYGLRGRHSATSTTTIITFWEFVVFLINSAIFLLIGLEISISSLVDNAVPLAITIGGVLLARAVVVYFLGFVANKLKPSFVLKWAHVMFWGGLRGAVSIALVLSLPTALESRQLLITLAFGYVLFSLIGQGLTIGPLLKLLGLTRRSERAREFEELLAQSAAAQASIAALKRMEGDHLISSMLVDQLESRYEPRIQDIQIRLREMVTEEPSLVDTNVRLVQREITNSQKRAMRSLLNRGTISEEIYKECIGKIDNQAQERTVKDWILSSNLINGLEMEDLLVESYMPEGMGSE
ncbi:MAG: Na+/H+ antiporter [Chloroflexota bacterium]